METCPLSGNSVFLMAAEKSENFAKKDVAICYLPLGDDRLIGFHHAKN